MVDSSVGAEKLVGINVSRARLSAVSIDGGGNVNDSVYTPVVADVDSLEQLIDFAASAKTQFGEFANVGIAVPGLIQRETGRVAFSAHIPEHASTDIAQAVRSATGLNAVIENDANAAAYGEYKLGAGRGVENMFYATIGLGVGGALILAGQIWRGTAGFAGEFGYVTINSDGMRLEDVASSANIVRRTRSRFNRDSTSSLGKLSEEQIGIAEIVRAADEGDDFAALMLERTGNYVGTAIATVINLLNVERIVIGGEIMQARHLVLDAVIHRAKELSFAPSFEKTEIVSGELGDDAAAIGAALIANGV